MTTRTARWPRGLLVGIVTLVAGCDGGAGTAGIDGTGAPIGPLTPNVSPPDIAAVSSVIAYGTVTGFGSVWVNGVRYDTSQATFTINGRTGTQDELDIGHVVLVVGSFDRNAGTGVAQRVVYDSLVEGPISGIDVTGNSFVALGQTVEITGRTSYAETIPQRSLAGLRIGDIVGVSGFRDTNGAIKATRVVAKELSRRDFETTGAVARLSGVARRFNVNALVVDYGSAMLQGFSTGEIANGDIVKVRGSSLRSDGSLVATSVESAPTVLGNAGDRVEIEGIITSPYPVQVGATPPRGEQPSMRFAIERRIVETTGTTVFEGGSPYALWRDLRIEVEGSLRQNGVLAATRVRFVYDDQIRIMARVDSVSAMTETFRTLGITVKLDSLTQLADHSALRSPSLRLTDLVTGDYVSIRGIEFPADSGEVLASIIERRDAVDETELQGPFQSATWPTGSWSYPAPWFGTLQILGVTVVTTERTLYGWRDQYGVNGATFFMDMAPGVLVHVQGVQVGDRSIEATHLHYAH